MPSLVKNINTRKLKASLIEVIEKKLPFEVKEDTFQKIAQQVLKRAKKIGKEIKKNPVGAVKNIKQFLAPLDLPTTAKLAKKTVKKKTSKAKTKKKNVH